MRSKYMLVTESEKHENKRAQVASRSQCKKEDSRKHLEIESSLSRMTMDRGFLARSTDADLVTNTLLIQKHHNAAEAHQVSHEAPERHAVNCSLENFDRNGLGRVLLKEDAESTAQTFVDPVCVGRGERKKAEKSSECLHQSSGAGESDVRMIESSATTNDPRSPVAEPTEKALSRRGLLDVRRMYSISPRSIATCAFGRGSENSEFYRHSSVKQWIQVMNVVR